MIHHGEWGEWLEKSVDYSARTAQNLMKIFEEYGPSQLSLFGDNAKTQALANLSYTQAVALLGIPADEREQFVEENDLESMSTRELQQAIKEREQLKEALDSTQEQLSEIREENDGLHKSLQDAQSEKVKLDIELSKLTLSIDAKETEISSYNKKMDNLLDEQEVYKARISSLEKQLTEAKDSGNTDEIERLKKELDKTDDELANSYQRIKDLEKQLQEKPVDATTVEERIPEEVEKELHQLREKARLLEAKASAASPQADKAIVKFTVQFEVLVKEFRDLLGTLTEIQDDGARTKYKNAVKGLIDKMSEQL